LCDGQGRNGRSQDNRQRPFPYREVALRQGGEAILKVLINGITWAYNPEGSLTGITDAPNVPVEKALEPIVERGPRLHQAGEAGYR
jgi:trehalose utilization protein